MSGSVWEKGFKSFTVEVFKHNNVIGDPIEGETKGGLATLVVKTGHVGLAVCVDAIRFVGFCLACAVYRSADFSNPYGWFYNRHIQAYSFTYSWNTYPGAYKDLTRINLVQFAVSSTKEFLKTNKDSNRYAEDKITLNKIFCEKLNKVEDINDLTAFANEIYVPHFDLIKEKVQSPEDKIQSAIFQVILHEVDQAASSITIDRFNKAIEIYKELIAASEKFCQKSLITSEQKKDVTTVFLTRLQDALKASLEEKLEDLITRQGDIFEIHDTINKFFDTFFLNNASGEALRNQVKDFFGQKFDSRSIYPHIENSIRKGFDDERATLDKVGKLADEYGIFFNDRQADLTTYVTDFIGAVYINKALDNEELTRECIQHLRNNYGGELLQQEATHKYENNAPFREKIQGHLESVFNVAVQYSFLAELKDYREDVCARVLEDSNVSVLFGEGIVAQLKESVEALLETRIQILEEEERYRIDLRAFQEQVVQISVEKQRILEEWQPLRDNIQREIRNKIFDDRRNYQKINSLEELSAIVRVLDTYTLGANALGEKITVLQDRIPEIIEGGRQKQLADRDITQGKTELDAENGRLLDLSVQIRHCVYTTKHQLIQSITEKLEKAYSSLEEKIEMTNKNLLAEKARIEEASTPATRKSIDQGLYSLQRDALVSYKAQAHFQCRFSEEKLKEYKAEQDKIENTDFDIEDTRITQVHQNFTLRLEKALNTLDSTSSQLSYLGGKINPAIFDLEVPEEKEQV